ncbi:unannotated protein [freshwater metagenome]|uniref:Unannotated protein n=1 Tax=freshwater metagenome TaxID=449393 RepID=A0A6J7AUG7_9ZZZZ
MDLLAGLQRLVRHRPAHGASHHRTHHRVRARRTLHARRAGMERALPHRATRAHRQPPPRLRGRRARELVPRPRHGRGERRGNRRRAQRPRQLPGLQTQHAPVDDAHHRVCRSPHRRSRTARLVRRDQVDATQLDRPQRRRARPLREHGRRPRGIHHPARHIVRRVVHGARAGAPARRRARHRRLARRHRRLLDRRFAESHCRGGRLSQAHQREDPHRAPGRRSRKDRRLHRLIRHQSGQRPARPGVHRGLCAHGVRHRRNHGRAVRRPTRLRVRSCVLASYPADPTPDRRVVRRARARPHACHSEMAQGIRRRRRVRP